VPCIYAFTPSRLSKFMSFRKVGNHAPSRSSAIIAVIFGGCRWRSRAGCRVP
jgi:hypothetical protein